MNKSPQKEMQQNKLLFYTVAWVVAVLLLWVPVSTILAHGGGQLQVGPVTAGPYQVSVWTDPPTPRIDRDLHVTVAVADRLTNEPFLGADVTVTIYPMGSETAVFTKPARAEAATNRLFYEMDARLTEQGEYRVLVDVTSPDGDGQVEFNITVESALPLTWLFVLLGVGSVVWMAYMWRKRPLPTAPVRPPRR